MPVQLTLEALISGAKQDLSVPGLIEESLANHESVLTAQGAITANTGRYTGRSPKDKFFVKEPSSEGRISWGSVNQPFEEADFDVLLSQVITYLTDRNRYLLYASAGASPKYRIGVRVITERAWHSLFAKQLFRDAYYTGSEFPENGYTVISAPGFKADPSRHNTRSEAFVIVHLGRRLILIGGTEYAGEIKKSIFTVMNDLLPQQGIMSMHCSANRGINGDVALFFGLSGTGKTTLSTDPNRQLIGDDEHGWSSDGVFNVEGGCYAKCINLDAAKEPDIYNAIRFGSVLENVVVDKNSREPDYDDGSLTENTRAAYPLDCIKNSVPDGMGGHPNVIFFLTADAFGVLPPISQLTPEQTMFYFLAGYTSKLAGTERGVTEPEATFSACFGAPFLPQAPIVYANLLKRQIEAQGTKVYLVNTGWTGGGYGAGSRISLSHTRALVTAAINGELEFDGAIDPVFGLALPKPHRSVPESILNPRNAWQDKDAYDRAATQLAERFYEHVSREASLSELGAQAGPLAFRKG